MPSAVVGHGEFPTHPLGGTMRKPLWLRIVHRSASGPLPLVIHCVQSFYPVELELMGLTNPFTCVALQQSCAAV